MWKIKWTLLSYDQVNIFCEWIATGKNINSVKTSEELLNLVLKLKLFFLFLP